MNKKLKYAEVQKYYSHKRLFNIADNNLFCPFEELLNESDNFRLEPSLKINNDKIFSARFNIYYYGGKKEHVKNAGLVFGFFKKIAKLKADLNYNLIKQINISKIDFNRIEELVVGMDLRDNFNQSRLKFYLSVDGDPDLFNRVLKIHGYNNRIAELVYNSTLLFGIDLCFDGKTKIKIYLCFDSSHLNNFIIQKKLSQIFSKKINYFISQCNRIHTSFTDKNFERKLSFYPKSPASFIRALNNKKLNEIYNKLSLKNNDYYYYYNVISLLESEINKNALHNLIFYYS